MGHTIHAYTQNKGEQEEKELDSEPDVCYRERLFPNEFHFITALAWTERHNLSS